jgi:insertion element IS1 protein InsB
MKLDLNCPTCGSDDIMKNGTTRRGKQNHKCRDCGRQFVEDPQWQPKDTAPPVVMRYSNSN